MFCLGLAWNQAGAQGWDFTPRLTLGTIYTDNVDRDPPGEEESDLIVEAQPGFSAQRQGSRLQANIDYSLTGRASLLENRSNVDHQLSATSTAELYQEHFFLDANASVSQVIVDAEEPAGTSNLFGENRATAVNVGLSPYWIQDFGGYADAELRYRYDTVLFSEGDVSDSQFHSVTANLNSGRRFTALNWDLDYAYRRQNRQDGADDDGEDRVRQSAAGNLEYRLSREWGLLARFGYENNDVSTAETVDGTFWSVGAEWTPSRFIGIGMLYGPDDNEFILRFSPTTRTELQIRRLERDVGVDPGVRWFGSLQQRTRYSTWSATYTEETTNVQELLITGPLFDEEGNPIFQPDLPLTLQDEEFLRRRLDLTVGYGRARSSFSINVFGEQRDFFTDTEDEQAYGIDVSFNRRLAPRTSGLLGFNWQRSERDNEDGEAEEDDEWRFRLGLSRQLSPDLTGDMEYLYTRRDSTEAEQDYRENQLRAFLRMTF